MAKARYGKDVLEAAKKSNETDDKTDDKFRDTGSESAMGYTRGDPDGRANHAIRSAEDRKKLRDLLPGGTERLMDATKDSARHMDSYKKGGTVAQTGPALLHKGERVLNVAEARKFNRGGSKRLQSGRRGGR